MVCALVRAGSAANPAQAVIDMAHGAPGEFAADAMLRVAAPPGLDRAARMQAIGDAFQRAAEAQQPFKRVNAMPNIASNAAFQQRAFAQDLDALSLRTRAIDAMLPLDAALARRMFVEMTPLDVPALGCDDVMVFDVASYYEALSQIARRTFSDKELREGAAAQLVTQRMARLGSPAEVAPAARALGASGLDDAGFALALAGFEEALKRTKGDDRSFTFYLPDAGAAVQGLMAEAKRRKLAFLPLIEAYRLYLVINFSAARCADDDLMTGGSGEGSGAELDVRSMEAIRFYNQSIRVAPLLTITYAEAETVHKAGAASGLRSCASTGCVAVARRYRALVFDSVGRSLPNAARESTEWRDKFEDALQELRGWQDVNASSADDDAAQQFREKCAFYMELANLPPDAKLRETALIALLEYLGRSRDRARTRIEWLLPVNVLIGRAGLDPLGSGRLAEAFRKSDDPVIAMYAELERVAPRKAQEVFALM